MMIMYVKLDDMENFLLKNGVSYTTILELYSSHGTTLTPELKSILDKWNRITKIKDIFCDETGDSRL